jgi:Bardet-Biedl syndrome 4 protein
LYTASDFHACIKYSEKILQKEPLNKFACLYRALSCRAIGDIERCLDLLQKSKHAEDKEFKKQQARCFMLLGEHTKAYELLEEHFPGNEAFKEYIVLNWKVQLLIWTNHPNDAQKLAKKFLEEEPNALNVHPFLFLYDLTNDPSWLEKGLRICPGESRLLERLNECEKLGKAEIEDFKFRNDFNPSALMSFAAVAADAESIQAYKVLQDWNHGQVWSEVGVTLWNKGKALPAMACMERALFMDPIDWKIQYNTGLMYENNGRLSSAIFRFGACKGLLELAIENFASSDNTEYKDFSQKKKKLEELLEIVQKKIEILTRLINNS